MSSLGRKRPIVLCDEYSDGDVSTLNLDAAALSDKHSDDRASAGTNATKKVAGAFVVCLSLDPHGDSRKERLTSPPHHRT